MITGLGSDLIDSKRIQSAYEHHPRRLLDKLLSETEHRAIACCADPINFLSKRWAAKEAFAKACGTGIRSPILFPAITIANDALGKPSITPNKTIAAWLDARKLGNIHLSLSDEATFVLAFVIIEASAPE